MSIWDSILAGGTAGVTLGISQFIANEFVIPYLKRMRGFHQVGVGELRKKVDELFKDLEKKDREK